jgi:pimeloyl-ACP methyl ester carboxylesterase
MHGWQDNAASFDNLAPFLLKNTPILAIDLPGHGLSSWLPPGFMYNEIVYFLLIKRIKKHFGWKKMKLLAHSLSSMTTYWYAATFPMDLQYVIALDFYKFLSIDAIIYSNYFANAVNTFFKLEENNGVQPNYTYDELLKKGLANMVSDMDEATYKILMNRGSTKREDGKYIINRDPRLRIIAMHTLVAQEHQEQYAKLITCPYLIIKGSKLHEEKKENFYRPIEIMKSVNNNVHFKTLSRISKTTHHFHLTNAEETAAIINPFLEQYN